MALTLVVGACSAMTEGGADGGTVADAGGTSTADAGGTTVADAGSTTDGGLPPCTGPCKPGSTGANDCGGCIGNDDCSDGFFCSDTNNGTCECGPRGTGAFLTPCTMSTDCESGVCINGTTCSRTCTKQSDCGGSLPTCSPIGVCSP